MVTLGDIQSAQERLRAHLTPTPLVPAPALGARVWLKLENQNLTGSFKIRGALNAVLVLSDEARSRGVVAASSGNHAGALAYACQLAGVALKLYVPSHTPQAKLNNIRRWGADVDTASANYDEAEARARHTEADEGRAFISPYNDAWVIAGAGTIGLDILAQLPDVARVVVCVGGGGLVSGVGTALKALRPSCEVVGVCAESAPAMYNHLYQAHLPENWQTLAEALSGDIEAGSLTLEIAPRVLDRLLLVSEAHIAQAMRFLQEACGQTAEGGGSVGVAACLSGVLKLDGAPTAVIVSGGNVDSV